MAKNVVLGVAGSIAAYKAAEIASELVKRGYSVHTVMTRAARHFISPLTFQALTRNPAHSSMFSPPRDWEVAHISLADRADLILVAPATANILGKVAAGLADDLLTATIMAAKCPVLFAPAMNARMYSNPIVQRNMALLAGQGYFFVEPEEGRLACGAEGKGRLASTERILAAAVSLLGDAGDLAGRRVLVTAGPTREPIDPVRFISNRSSGKMGYALAAEARRRGAEVVLVSGPTSLVPPAGVRTVFVETAQEMLAAVLESFPSVDIVVKAAAVADFRPRERAPEKIKKEEAALTLELERTPDILGTLGEQKKSHQILVGFAAETKDLFLHAEEKLRKKNLDLLVANDVTEEGAGFEVDTNIVTLFYPDGTHVKLPKMRKQDLARVIFDRIVKILEERQGRSGT